MLQRPLSFTTKYGGLSNVLSSEAHIGQPYDPSSPPSQLTPATCNAVKYAAIWDTGATNCVVSIKVVQDCNLKPIGMVVSHTVNGDRNTNIYIASLFLPNNVAFGTVKLTEGTITGGDILIGMDIIGAGDFAVSSFGGHTTFSYRYPSCDCIDFVTQPPPGQTMQPIGTGHHIGRNDPCPCGSGKKYKRCHGLNS